MKKIDENIDHNIDENEEKNISIELAIERLEEIAESLEDPEISLKDSLEKYAEGVALIKECRETLMDVEKEMIVLEKEGEISDK